MRKEERVRRNGLSGFLGSKDNAERYAFEAIKIHLRDAFSVADSDYELVSADDIRRRVCAGAGS